LIQLANHIKDIDIVLFCSRVCRRKRVVRWSASRNVCKPRMGYKPRIKVR